MQLINAYFGTTLLESIEQALATNKGDRFDVGVGFAQHLTGATFNRFGEALESWLASDQNRRFRIFIGDHQHENDTPRQRKEKIDACTKVVANLSNFARCIEERMEVVFLHKLHAKFYSMWSHVTPLDRLEWAIVGSSNLSDAALEEKNIELDIYLEPGDPQLQTIQKPLAAVIHRAWIDGELSGKLHDKVDSLTAKTRWENSKLRYGEERDAEIEAEWQSEERREAEERARLESDQRLGITGPE
ncbi:phospholipase D-like domain-containing protein [Rhodoferax sp. TS-BS-61-7]|uniref:phospholipase D-like domain-containing protein n=1 Tax=Rhodoferax sp. TS-BS-61-7 TaxID=2094194 RepID=UPI000CF5E5FF|nr:phospholipase D-like domain-containing protein [Rhodoferax sp. TS-BS-61-7]PQA78932.1 hypothetical protein C5F53_02910 [Rhodoferax sp. TS-BS-61-7]